MTKSSEGKEQEAAARAAGVEFLTSHAHALICLAAAPGIRMRDLAERVGVNERSAYRLVVELEQAGHLTRHRFGHRNFYEVHPGQPLHQPLPDRMTVGDLLSVFIGSPQAWGRM
jgi:hypothetical protein